MTRFLHTEADALSTFQTASIHTAYAMQYIALRDMSGASAKAAAASSIATFAGIKTQAEIFVCCPPAGAAGE